MEAEPIGRGWGTKRGVVALGDSLTYANQSPKLGRLRPQSWALWLAETLELPFTNLAFNGARATDVLSYQVPRLRGPYELGTLNMGTNDLVLPAFDIVEFERTLRTIVEAMGRHADRLLFLSIATNGGERKHRSRCDAVNDLFATVADEVHIPMVRIDDFAGWRLMLPDRHPTAVGQLTIAHRAVDALRSDGVPVAGDLPDAASAPGPLGMWLHFVIERPILFVRNVIGRNLLKVRRLRAERGRGGA
jgi:lysophospholipase L1-like esterase